MGKKHLSLIIVPHNKSEYRTLSFSRRVVKTAQWTAVILGVLILALTADYFRIRFNRHNIKALTSENALQKETLTRYENSIGMLKKKIGEFDDYVKKLNLMAGITSSDILKDVGGGGRSYVPPEGQNIPGLPPIGNPGSVKGLQDKASDIQKNLDTLVTFFRDQGTRLASTPTIYPTAGLLTSKFGWRPDPFTGKQTFHYGLDIAAAFGNPIVATADGVVIVVNTDKLLGRSVQINHGLGITTIYGHMIKFNCRVGQKIKRGDVIGEVGNSGKALGPHVHYEVRVNGTSVNPYFYILE